MPIKQLQNKAAAERKLWDRLEVLPEDLFRHPTITPILISGLGKIEKVIDVLRGCDVPEAREIIRIWELGSIKEHKAIPFEAYCLSAKTTPKKIVGIIMQAVVEQSSVASEMMLAAAHPEIVQKTIKIAKTIKGVDERKVILQNRGVLPSPKNQVFNNFGSVDNRKQLAVNVSQLEKDSDDIALAVDGFNTTRVLKAPDRPEVVDVIAEDE